VLDVFLHPNKEEMMTNGINTTQASTETATLHDEIRDRMQGNAEYLAADREVLRLRSERAGLQSKYEQLKAQAGDTSELVHRIERGESLVDSEEADRLTAMAAQLEAYGVAISRAEQRRAAVLHDVSRELCEEFAAEHLDKIQAINDALATLEIQIKSLDEIPAALRKFGISVDHQRLRLNHFEEMMKLVPRFSHFRGSFLPYLTRKGI